ncbi:MAG: hypothetical protein CSA62_06970 [Planctomycetota bacterium]|nr:MAG: hypothetical protein CSA62_06970 [Planctomycetota bacterium]
MSEAPSNELPIRLLVLANLLCVHVTGAVSLLPMLGLYALTLCSPLLARRRNHWLYRSIWNSAVLALCGMLLLGAQRYGVQTMLEDGLLLAAFCQVHLLNNLGPKQRPDLVFFNAFLIAIVTSFFSQELRFGLVLLFFFPALFLSLQQQLLGRATTITRLAKSILKPTLACLALTAIAFVLLPRDFQRQGFVAEYLEQGHQVRAVGLADNGDLDRERIDPNQSWPVLRLTRQRGEALPRYWRAVSDQRLVGRSWRRTRHPQSGAELPPKALWRRQGRSWFRGQPSGTPSISVEELQPHSAWVLMPMATRVVHFESRAVALEIRALVDGSLARSGARARSSRRYSLQLGAGSAQAGERNARRFARQAQRFSHFDISKMPPQFLRYAEDARNAVRGIPRGLERWQALCRFVASSAPYALPGQPGAAATWEDFLAGRGGAHCEWFASALVLLLRNEGVPCRIARGFAIDDPDPQKTTVIVQSSDAHAWVEILEEARGVILFDPTPSTTREDSPTKLSWHEALSARFSSWWQGLTNYDGSGRSKLLAALAALPRQAGRFVRSRPLLSLALIGLLLLLLARLRRRRALPAGVQEYERCLRRLGLPRAPEQTPREFLESLRDSGLTPKQLQRLERATERHERMRYARS